MAVISNPDMLEARSPEAIGKVVRFHRKRAGLSQRALADLAGIGKTSVFDIEKGKSTVRLATLLAVFDALNLKLNLAGPLMSEFGHAGSRT